MKILQKLLGGGLLFWLTLYMRQNYHSNNKIEKNELQIAKLFSCLKCLILFDLVFISTDI